MFFNAIVGCTLLAAVVSAFAPQSANAGKVRKDGALYRHVAECMPSALTFKSDLFKPVGSSAEKNVQGTVYSLTGSIYEDLYFSSDPATTDATCSTAPAESFGAYVNLCNVGKGFSYKLQLTDNSCNGFTIQYFSDKLCANYIGLSQGYAAAGQCRMDPATDPPNAYLISSCTTQAAPEMTTNTLAMQLYYSDDCTGSPWGYVGQELGHCFRSTYNTSETAEFFSYSCNGAVPSKTTYTDQNCNVSIATTTVPSGCDEFPAEGSNDDVFNPPPSVSTTAFPTSIFQQDQSVFVYCPTTAPTLKPALGQTSYPTLAAAAPVSFEIIQGLTGIDAATLNGNSVALSTVIATIAGAMPGITSDNIQNMRVADYSSGRWSSFTFLTPMASTAIVTLTYVVSATSVYSADNLYLRLSNAIHSGGFTTDLNANALASGATVLDGCSSNFASYTIDWDWDDDSIDQLSDGAIAGIVIGVVAFVAIIGGLIYFCFCRRRPSAPMSSHGAKPAVELNSNKA